MHNDKTKKFLFSMKFFLHLFTAIKKIKFVKAVINDIGASATDIFRLASK